MLLPKLNAFKRRISQAAVLVLSCLFIFSFQNCGKMSSQSENSSSVAQLSTSYDPSFFTYPFVTAPVGFSSAQFAAVKITGSTSKNVEAQFTYAFAQTSDSDSAVSYAAQLVNASNYPICPGVSGTFDAGQTTITIACESLTYTDSAHLLVYISRNGKTMSVENQF